MNKSNQNNKLLRNKSRAHLSWQLIIAAYLIEFLLLAVSVITALTTSNRSDDAVFILSASLFTLLLCFVEPLKIIIAQAIVILTSLKWRALALLLLIFTTALSVENVSQSAKMTQKNSTQDIEILRNNILKSRSDLNALLQNYQKVENLSSSLASKNSEETSSLKADIFELDTKIEFIKNENNKTELASVNQLISNTQLSIKALKSNFAVADNDCFQRKVEMQDKMQEALKEILIGRSSVSKRYEKDLDALEEYCINQIDLIADDIDKEILYLKELQKFKSDLLILSDDNKVEVKRLKSKIYDAENRIDEIVRKEGNIVLAEEKFIAQKQQQLLKIDSDIEIKASKIEIEEDRIRNLKTNNILYSIAGSWYGVHPSILEDSKFEAFTSVWMWIASICICLIPPILAILSEVITIEGERDSTGFFGTVMSYYKNLKKADQKNKAEYIKKEEEADKHIKNLRNKNTSLQYELEFEKDKNNKADKAIEFLNKEKDKIYSQNINFASEKALLKLELDHAKKDTELYKDKLEIAKSNKQILPLPIEVNNHNKKYLEQIMKWFFSFKVSKQATTK